MPQKRELSSRCVEQVGHLPRLAAGAAGATPATAAGAGDAEAAAALGFISVPQLLQKSDSVES